LTQVWLDQDQPLIEVGLVELNRNPQNCLAEVEQAAFAPANGLPGIGFSPDKMLQARILTYPDAHRYGLGVNYEFQPVNRPHSAANTDQRDSSMCFDSNSGPAVNYITNPTGSMGPRPTRSFLSRRCA
jgi:catalase